MVVIRPQVRKQGKGGGGARFGGGKGGHQGGKGGGNKGGKAGGNWVFVPAAAPLANRFGNRGAAPVGNRFGKGGKGHSGKGHTGNAKPVNKTMDKLDKIDAERKVWVGGLPKDKEATSWKKLSAHFEEGCGKPSIVEVMRGSACLAFKTAEEAEAAIGALNGSEFDGQILEVDVWTKKEKKERPERAKKQKSIVAKTTLKLKNGKKAGDSPMKLKLKAVDHSLKAWIGGLSSETKWKAIKQHFVDNGCEVDLVDLLGKPGTAVVTFKTEDEVAAAVGSLNGTDLDGETIEVDVWTKPERREKKNKVD